MPSETPAVTNAEHEEPGALPVEAVLEALRPALDPFRSAVAEAAEEVRQYRASHEEMVADPAGRMARELGPFAQGLIDPLRLASLLRDGGPVDPLADRIMVVAQKRFAAAGSEAAGSHRLAVPPDADLRDSVKDALAEVGQVFATARAVEKARQRRYEPDRDHLLLHAYPFQRWTAEERVLAPALVVEVAGAGLRGAGLLEFMEGSQKFVLLVRGKAPPAPLARLASPGVLVAQVEAAEAMEAVTELAGHDGPGVVAVFEPGSGALRFRHSAEGVVEVDPEALASALEAAEGAAGRPGLLDLRYLDGVRAAAARAAAPPAPAGPPPPPTQGAADSAPAEPAAPGEPSVDQLADWLLARTDPGAD